MFYNKYGKEDVYQKINAGMGVESATKQLTITDRADEQGEKATTSANLQRDNSNFT